MAIRRGDDDWFQIVRWSFYTMVEAEELGITQKKRGFSPLQQESECPPPSWA